MHLPFQLQNNPPEAGTKRILLLGGTGRVGKLVVWHWREMATERIQLFEQHRDTSQTTGFYWSLQEDRSDILVGRGIDAIVSLAGITPRPGAELSLNKSLATAVMRAAFDAGIDRVLLASSSAVYGVGDGTPMSEASPTKPVNDYGRAKLEMEHACSTWRDKGLKVCCLRIGNVAGADALLQNVARTANNHPVTIDTFADGRGPVRSYIGPRSLARVLATLTTHDALLPKVMNIAAPDPISMDALAKAAGHPWTARSAQPTEQQNITLNTRLLGEFHCFAPEESCARQMILQWREALRP
jgi:nucleoside-diphosphate-sugar epimerase